jgi:hypothetical protein
MLALNMELGIDTIQANVNKLQPHRNFLTALPSLNGSKCPKKRMVFVNQFPKGAQGIWGKVPRGDKAIILKVSKPKNANCNSIL